MTTLKFRMTHFALAAAAVSAIGAGALTAVPASAGNTDGPWPEPPSCSNDTGTCTSIEDQLAYECFFEEDTDGMAWCETDLEDMLEMHREPVQSFKLVQPTPPPPPPFKAFVAR